jgi:hypothetical protein
VPDPSMLEHAGILAAGMGLEHIDGGWRVKTAGTHYLDVMRQIWNWRLVTTPLDDPLGYDRGWCYAGTGPASFLAAVLAAMAWDGADGTEPEGWNKNVQTGEWREPEST